MLAILGPMSVEPNTAVSAPLAALHERVDGTLYAFLGEVRAEIAAVASDALLPIDEIERLVAAGGRRLRPAFCYWGYRAAGGRDGDPIVRVASALELLHAMALIHDDLMDESPLRRGVPTSAVRFASDAERRGSEDPDKMGRSLAILAGDLAAVLADRLFLSSGFAPDVLVPALDRYHRMRTNMAMGQTLDVLGAEGTDRFLVASLKGGAYTVAGPLAIGAELAGAGPDVQEALAAFGDPLGTAFQFRDDERDGDAPVPPGRVADLASQARLALERITLDREAREALLSLAGLVEAG